MLRIDQPRSPNSQPTPIHSCRCISRSISSSTTRKHIHTHIQTHTHTYAHMMSSVSSLSRLIVDNFVIRLLVHLRWHVEGATHTSTNEPDNSAACTTSVRKPRLETRKRAISTCVTFKDVNTSRLKENNCVSPIWQRTTSRTRYHPLHSSSSLIRVCVCANLVCVCVCLATISRHSRHQFTATAEPAAGATGAG